MSPGVKIVPLRTTTPLPLHKVSAQSGCSRPPHLGLTRERQYVQTETVPDLGGCRPFGGPPVFPVAASSLSPQKGHPRSTGRDSQSWGPGGPMSGPRYSLEWHMEGGHHAWFAGPVQGKPGRLLTGSFPLGCPSKRLWLFGGPFKFGTQMPPPSCQQERRGLGASFSSDIPDLPASCVPSCCCCWALGNWKC